MSGGGFFGFSTELPELTAEELLRLEQIHALEEEDDKNNDTFGDIDELEEYIPQNPDGDGKEDEMALDLLEGLRALGLHQDAVADSMAMSLLEDSDLIAPTDLLVAWPPPSAAPAPPAQAAPLSVEELEARLRQRTSMPPVRGTPYMVSEYNNLMTQSEKDFIIRIQMTQLQATNPAVDDYYYQAYTLKQRARAGDASAQHKLYTVRHGLPKDPWYTPVSFENTLGKIAAYTVTAPRPLIDVRVKREAGGGPGAGGTRRRLCGIIEAAATIAIGIEDTSMEMLAVPDDRRAELEARRNTMLDEFYAKIRLGEKADDEALLRLLTIDKAQRLIAKVTPLSQTRQLHALALFLLRNAPTLDHAVDGIPVYGHIGEVIDAVGRALHQGGQVVASDILTSITEGGTAAVRTTLGTKTGRAVVRAVAWAGAGARDAVGQLVVMVKDHVRDIAGTDGGWALLRGLYVGSPKPEKALLAGELRGLAEEQQATSLDARAFVAAL